MTSYISKFTFALSNNLKTLQGGAIMLTAATLIKPEVTMELSTKLQLSNEAVLSGLHPLTSP